MNFTQDCHSCCNGILTKFPLTSLGLSHMAVLLSASHDVLVSTPYLSVLPLGLHHIQWSAQAHDFNHCGFTNGSHALISNTSKAISGRACWLPLLKVPQCVQIKQTISPHQPCHPKYLLLLCQQSWRMEELFSHFLGETAREYLWFFSTLTPPLQCYSFLSQSPDHIDSPYSHLSIFSVTALVQAFAPFYLISLYIASVLHSIPSGHSEIIVNIYWVPTRWWVPELVFTQYHLNFTPQDSRKDYDIYTFVDEETKARENLKSY